LLSKKHRIIIKTTASPYFLKLLPKSIDFNLKPKFGIMARFYQKICFIRILQMAPCDVIVMIKWNHQKISNYLLVICSKNCKDWWKLMQLYLMQIGPVFWNTLIISEPNRVFWTEPNSFQTESEFFQNTEPKPNRD